MAGARVNRHPSTCGQLSGAALGSVMADLFPTGLLPKRDAPKLARGECHAGIEQREPGGASQPAPPLEDEIISVRTASSKKKGGEHENQ